MSIQKFNLVGARSVEQAEFLNDLQLKVKACRTQQELKEVLQQAQKRLPQSKVEDFDIQQFIKRMSKVRSFVINSMYLLIGTAIGILISYLMRF